MELPKKYNHRDVESKWMTYWSEQGTYDWDASVTREKTFSIDTPPPTVSGSLHIGHVFSYTQTDVIARYQRMKGKNVFYPMGWDDNGLPTERRVQQVFNIACDPNVPYDPDWTAKKGGHTKHVQHVSRRNFIDACLELTHDDEKAFEAIWRQLGLSVDWSLQYATIDPHCQKTSQQSFLDMVNKDMVYSVEAPTMWDTDFQTAVAQAEVEDRERPGAYHYLDFGGESGETFTIATTRPELLPACIAVVAHPDDARYQSLFGTYAVTPLFRARVPILASDHADPDKGSGILMVCTFGDAADVEWWKQRALPIRQVIGSNGRYLPIDFSQEPFSSIDATAANAVYSSLEGLKVRQAQKKIVELLAEPGSGYDGISTAMSAPINPIEHPVKFYEKGESPIEFMTHRQWFVRLLDHKAELLAQGEHIEWHPSFMKRRYTNWVEGLNQDWCISRQRFFGVPFPVWYPLDHVGQPDYASPIYADTEQLPMDPMSDTPPGFSEDQRGKAGGFIGDPDVMDTWATSSLTPQIASHWVDDPKRHERIFPMDMRPQSHEIIRTWAFYTITKAWIHDRSLPWHHVAISGWVLDPDRKKMSKSKGNVVTPNALLEEYSSDAVRYWAARARLGADTAVDSSVFHVGKKVCTKLFNASKFVLMQLHADDIRHPLLPSEIIQPIDRSYLRMLNDATHRASEYFDALDYAGALDTIESAFWLFCDHYIELVKIRAYRGDILPERRSALATLSLSLHILLRLFAPFLPFVTDEIWSWEFSESDSHSIHRSAWPSDNDMSDVDISISPEVMTLSIEVMTAIRGAKSEANVSLKAPVEHLNISGSESDIAFLDKCRSDIVLAGAVDKLTIDSGDTPDDQRLLIDVNIAS